MWEPFDVSARHAADHNEDLAVFYRLPEDILALKVDAINAHVSQVEAIVEAVGADVWWKDMSTEMFPPRGGPGVSGPWMAFLGSGEFDPWSEPVDRWALERSRNPSGPVLVCADGGRARGRCVVRRMGEQGWSTTRRSGSRPRCSCSRRARTRTATTWSGGWTTRRSCSSRAGTPPGSADVLSHTPFWEAVVRARADGLPYAGAAPAWPPDRDDVQLGDGGLGRHLDR